MCFLCLCVIAHLAGCNTLGGVSMALRVGGVLQVLVDNVCGFAGRRGVDKVTQGANLTKSPQPLSHPQYPSTSIQYPAGLAFPDQCVLAWRARPLLPVPSWGFLHAGRWAESKRQVRDTVISAQVNLIPWVDFFFFEKLTSGFQFFCVCFSWCLIWQLIVRYILVDLDIKIKVVNLFKLLNTTSEVCHNCTDIKILDVILHWLTLIWQQRS